MSITMRLSDLAADRWELATDLASESSDKVLEDALELYIQAKRHFAAGHNMLIIYDGPDFLKEPQ